jgi:DNA-binding CsgD family transcriptional regulator
VAARHTAIRALGFIALWLRLPSRSSFDIVPKLTLSSEALAHARDCADPHAHARWLLARLEREVGFDSAVYLPLSGGAPVCVNKDGFERFARAFVRDSSRYGEGMAKADAAAKLGGGVYVDTDVFDARERDALPLYAEVVRPQGIRSQLVIHADFHGRRAAIAYLCRHGRARAFSARELAQVRPVVPAVAMAQLAYAANGAAPAAGHARRESLAVDTGLAALTPRQREIAALVARGLRNRDIAAVLGTSPHTVHNQLKAIFARLELDGRAELAVLADREARARGAG